MIYSPIWKDITYSNSASTLDYIIIEPSGNTIHSGYTIRMPDESGVVININNRVEEYLGPGFETDFRGADNDVIINPDGFKAYQMRDISTSGVLETYGFLYDWSYDDRWTGQTGYMMSEPINGHIDPRMKTMFTMYNSAETTFNYDIEYDLLLDVVPRNVIFGASGGTRELVATSRGSWDVTDLPAWCTLDVTSHTGSYQVDVTPLTLSVSEFDGSSRSGDIDFSGDGGFCTVEVEQFDTYFEITPVSHHYGYEGGTILIRVDYNVPFTYASDSDWLNSGGGGSVDAQNPGMILTTYIPATADRNDYDWDHTGHIVFTYGPSADTKTFEAYQDMRTDNKVFYKAAVVCYPFRGEYRQVWGAKYVTEKHYYDSVEDCVVGFVAFDNVVRGYGGLVDASQSPACVIPYIYEVNFEDYVTKIYEVPLGDFNDYGDVGLSTGFAENKHLWKTPTKLNGITRVEDGSMCHSWMPEPVALPNAQYIGYFAFGQGKIMSGITFSDSLTTIRPMAFLQSSGLTEVTIPASVTDFGKFIIYNDVVHGKRFRSGMTFYNCEDLTSVTYNAVADIEYASFADCTNLSTVNIGNNVTRIKDYAFSGCTSLESVIVPANVTSMGRGVFENTGLKSFTVMRSMDYIPERVCARCANLTAVTIPSNIKEIIDGAFLDCTSLKSVTIPGTVERVHSGVFSGCTSLTSVTIENGVKYLCDPIYGFGQIFKDCTSLERVVIPDSVVQIGHQMFAECTALTSVTIGSGVTTMASSLGGFIYGETFRNCSSLVEIIAKPRVAPTIEYPFAGCVSAGVLHYPAGSDYTSWIAELPSNWTAVADL